LILLDTAQARPPSSLLSAEGRGIRFDEKERGKALFSWPGMGRLTIQAIANRDYYLVQGCILAIGLTYVAVNFLTDLLYSAVNPRIRQ
jgi:ABC-type microcin C transport system permease subunit YejB